MKVKIFDNNSQKFIEASLEEESTDRQIQIVKIFLGKETIGEMLYSLKNDSLDISKLENKQRGRYANIGTLLLNYAFDLSIQHGKEGRITLFPVKSSIEFWKKMQFEFTLDGKEMYLSEKSIQAKINSEDYKLSHAIKIGENLGFRFKLFDEEKKEEQRKTDGPTMNKLKK